MSELVQCKACGGSIVWDPSTERAACLFCGSTALRPADLHEAPASPHAMLPVTVDHASADRSFRAWARSSFWHPNELRAAQIHVRTMLLPAWWFRGRVETHYAGLVRAATLSGKRPMSGVEHATLTQMVTASQGLAQHELSGLQPWNEAQALAWPEQVNVPFEPPALTERAARTRAHDLMSTLHAQQIAGTRELSHCKASSMIDDLDVRLYMLPIYVGAFRYRERAFRFVVNAQTGAIVGNAPIDRLKVALVVLVGLAAVMVLAIVAAR